MGLRSGRHIARIAVLFVVYRGYSYFQYLPHLHPDHRIVMKLSKYLIIMMLAAVAAVSCNKDGSAVVNVSVSPSELTVPYTRSTDKSFEVQADGAWTVKALSSAGHELSWVRFGRMRGNGNAKVSLTVNANEYKDSCVAKLTVTSASGNVAAGRESELPSVK